MIPSSEKTPQTMYCAGCGARLAPGALRCPECRAPVSALQVDDPQARRLTLARVGILTLLTLGLYYFYWLYVTWKHLASERPDKRFYPIWHALSQLAPGYGFVVIYQHFALIKELQEEKGQDSGINPLLAAAAVVVFNVGGLVDYAYPQIGLPILPLILPLVIVGVVVWGQANLNAYWESVHGDDLKSAGVEPGEALISVGGGILTLVLIATLAFPPRLELDSALDATSISPIVVGSSGVGSAYGFRGVIAHSFVAQEGVEYSIRVDAAAEGDPLESASARIWDSDGVTAVRHEIGQTPLGVSYTAATGGAKYVTIESGGDEGNYVISITAVGR